jgi:hypothetical protein
VPDAQALVLGAEHDLGRDDETRLARLMVLIDQYLSLAQSGRSESPRLHA